MSVIVTGQQLRNFIWYCHVVSHTAVNHGQHLSPVSMTTVVASRPTGTVSM